MINLREARKNKGLSQKQLSDLSGVSQQSISSIEKGIRKNPGSKALFRLATALEMNMEDLIVEEASENG